MTYKKINPKHVKDILVDEKGKIYLSFDLPKGKTIENIMEGQKELTGEPECKKDEDCKEIPPFTALCIGGRCYYA